MGDADRLPMTNVNRIMMAALPKDAAVAKEAKVAISACATVFLHYITELAIQQCDKRKKVTLHPDDILEALREAEFDEFEEPIKEAVQAFKTSNAQAKKPPAKKQKVENTNNSLNDSVNDQDPGNTSLNAGGAAVPPATPESSQAQRPSATPQSESTTVVDADNQARGGAQEQQQQQQAGDGGAQQDGQPAADAASAEGQGAAQNVEGV